MDIKRIATAIDNLHTLSEERLDEVIAEVRANRDILERLEKQGNANALAIAELKGIMMASTPQTGSGPAPKVYAGRLMPRPVAAGFQAGVRARTRRGLPEPSSSLSGAVKRTAPVGGSRSRLFRHCRPYLPAPCM